MKKKDMTILDQLTFPWVSMWDDISLGDLYLYELEAE